MKRLFFFILIFGALFQIQAQQKPVEVVYREISNGKADTADSKRFVYFENMAYLSENDEANREFIDYTRKATVDIILLDGKTFKTVTPFEKLDKPVEGGTADIILGYVCSKAVFKSFSNTIETWYTTETVAKGSPYKNFLPENSLVLRIVINGNYELEATAIREKEGKFEAVYPYEEAATISKAELRELQIRSRFVNLPVFDREVVNYGDSIVNPPFGIADSTYRFSNGTVILKKIKLPESSKKGAMVYATLINWSNGDAYDRTCSLFTLTEKKDKTILDAFQQDIGVMPVKKDKKGEEYQGITSTQDYEVPVELMRFFTSFGVSHFNKIREINNYDWQDSVVYKQEITPLIPNDKDEIWIGVFIGNYDKGGHKVSLDLQFYPAWEEADNAEKYICPLFSTLNVLEMSGQNYGRLFDTDTLSMEFELPENIEGLQLLYTTTGHGGWEGGDEFNPKRNEVIIDDSLVFSVVPWRTDCGTYRMSNPASGNFENGLSSSDLSRSNWCPATLTPPYYIPLPQMKPGKHRISVVIDQGEDEGGSFSHWAVSGVLTGEVVKKEKEKE